MRWPLVLPATSAGRRLVLVALVDAAGTGVFLSCGILFLAGTAGLSAAEIGIGMSVAGVVGLLSSVPVGIAADRFGQQRALVVLQLWRGGWFVAYAFVDRFSTFLLVVCLLGLAEKATGPVNQAVVGIATGGEDRVRTMAMMRSVRNVGFSLGALGGTAAAGFGSDLMFRGTILVNAASFAVAALLVARLRMPAAPAGTRRGAPWRGLRSLRDGGYLAIAALNGVLVLHMTMLSVGIPLWILHHTAAPPQLTSSVILVNTLLVVLFQVRSSRGCDDVPVAAKRLRWAGVSLAGACLLLAVSAGFGPVPATALVVTAVGLLALGELWQAAGAWGVSYELAEPDRRAEYLSVFSLGVTAQSIAGPALLTTLVLPHGMIGWAALAGLLSAAGFSVPWLVRRVVARRKPAADQFYDLSVSGGDRVADGGGVVQHGQHVVRHVGA